MFSGISKFLSGFSVYDVTQSEVNICGRQLMDLTSAEVTYSNPTKVEEGIDEAYYSVLSIPVNSTLSVSVLPESEDSKFIRNLEKFCRNGGGYFKVFIAVSGRLIGTFDAHFLSIASDDISEDPSDNTYTIGLKRADQVVEIVTKTTPLKEVNNIEIVANPL